MVKNLIRRYGMPVMLLVMFVGTVFFAIDGSQQGSRKSEPIWEIKYKTPEMSKSETMIVQGRQPYTVGAGGGMFVSNTHIKVYQHHTPLMTLPVGSIVIITKINE